MDPNFAVALNQEALLIFTIIHEFFCGTDAHKRNDALESFPQSFEFIPWRRVYKQPAAAEAQSGATGAHHLIVKQHWEPSELPFGGAGFFWCFTVLLRIGENVSRKTEDGQTWSSKSGRAPKKGFPDQIRVDRLHISGKVFDMLELTLNLEKPNVALCKIWRKGNAEAASPQIMNPGASTSHQVENSPIHEGLTEEMQIDQPQGQLEGEQQQMHDSELSMSGYVLVDSTQGCIQSTWQDDDSIYQDAVSYLYKGKESFKHVASCSKDKAHEIASAAQSLASTLRNAFNFLGIKKEPENTRPTNASDYSDQIMGADNSVANTAEPAPDEAMTQEELPDQELVQLTAGYSIVDNDINYNYFNPDDFIDLDGGNGTNFDADYLGM